MGRLPSKRQARIGLALVAWCLIGLGVLAATGVFGPQWVQFGVQIALLWLAFAGIIMRRAGHRGKCWRTRSWRQAWGGLAPGGGLDPTRPAGT
jgi:membrane protease YdiL (CAAX protease family)